MKPVLALLIPLALIAGLLPGATFVDDWEGCVRQVEGTDTGLPRLITDWDGTFGAIRESVPYQRWVLDMTKARLASGPVGAPERHLTENGLMGCRRFQAAYDRQIRVLRGLLASLGALILVLTARVGLAIVPAFQRRKVAHESPTPPHSGSVSHGR